MDVNHKQYRAMTQNAEVNETTNGRILFALFYAQYSLM
jgi:hypothetical protein